MDRLLGWLGIAPFADLAPAGQLLALIVVGTLGLFTLAVLFAIVVIGLRMRHVGTQQRRLMLEARWRGPLLGVLGGEREPEAMHAELRRGEELELLAFLVPYARRVRGAEAELLRRVAAPALPRLATELRSGSPESRALAVEMLALLGTRHHTADVVRALDDPSPYVAMTAAQALAKPEHGEHAAAVVGRIWRFSSWSPAYVSAMLARIGEAVVPVARALLADPREPIAVRAITASVLARRNDLLAADVAAQVLASSDSDPAASSARFQEAALALLGQVGHAGHRPVPRMLASAPDPVARAAAIRALSAIGDGTDGEAMLTAIADPSPYVAQEAARALLRVGRADLLQPIASAGGAAALFARQALREGRS